MLESWPLSRQIAAAARSRQSARRTPFGRHLLSSGNWHSTELITSRIDIRKMPQIVEQDELGFDSAV